jgi:hypothetical protein
MRDGSPIYHVLLIGIDAYPAEHRSLYGCVNDIDTIESLLLEMHGEDARGANLQITRLAAPHADSISSSCFHAQTLPPTKYNIIRAMKAITEIARPGDKALIYYSGHGYYLRWTGGTVCHEAIVTCDLQFLYDVELNRLINDLAHQVAGELTVVLDCCYSAGTFREIAFAVQGGKRSERCLDTLDTLNTDSSPYVGPRPDSSLVQPHNIDQPDAQGGASLWRASEPNYIVIAACQAVEVARERPMDDERYYGLLTYALATIIGRVPAARRSQLRWVDLWPLLLDEVDRLGHIAPRTPQHPWWVGRPERRVFGGPWRRHDFGFLVRESAGGKLRVGAGSLMGLSVGAEIAVYGEEPALFPPLGTSQDLSARLGVARVVEVDRVKSLAERVEGSLEVLPRGSARGRLVKAAPTQRLSVALEPPDPLVIRSLEESSVLRVSGAATEEPDVWVSGTQDSGWTIGDAVTREIARVPGGAIAVLRAGLVQYARFYRTLRLPRLLNTPGYAGPLEVALLDCNDQTRMDKIVDIHDPNLPLLQGVNASSYVLPTGTRFCMRIRNNFTKPLYVNVFNCEAFGIVDYMGELTVRAGDQQVLWRAYIAGSPWILLPSRQRHESRATSIDRLIIVATSRPGVLFSDFTTDRTVQQVVDTVSEFRHAGMRVPHGRQGSVSLAELWAAQMMMVKIGPEVRADFERVKG